MMNMDGPVGTTTADIFTSMPEHYRRAGARTAWADANKQGAAVDSFIEGPAIDGRGNLFTVDIPHGRIFTISPEGDWKCLIEYDGEPNGLASAPDGRMLVADYRRGLLELDTGAGTVRPVLERVNGESFKGLNDLTTSRNGDVYFTDQGQTGLQDPTGRVYRLRSDGRLDRLLHNVPSPNGLVLDAEERVLFVAATRDNSIWRVPLTDSGAAKAGRFASFFGTSGPDGLALTADGRLLVAHASLGRVFVLAPNGELKHQIRSPSGTTCTNVCLDPANPHRIYITESATGTILTAELPPA